MGKMVFEIHAFLLSQINYSEPLSWMAFENQVEICFAPCQGSEHFLEQPLVLLSVLHFVGPRYLIDFSLWEYACPTAGASTF